MIAIFPELALAASSGNAEELAVLVRRYFGGDEARSANPDISKMLAAAGIALVRAPIDVFAAVAVEDNNGRFRIVVAVNDRLDKVEERFALGHCMGHIFFEIQPKIAAGQVGKIGFKEDISPMHRYSSSPLDRNLTGEAGKREALADEFSGALLLPQGMVFRAVETLRNHAATAKFFGVNPELLEARLRRLNALVLKPASFLDGERQLMGKVEDPVLASNGPLDLTRLRQPARAVDLGAAIAKQQALQKANSTNLSAKPAIPPEVIKAVPSPVPASGIPGARSPAQPQKSSGNSIGSPGLAKLRKLAKLIDESVDA
jgi:hypothetical protein